MTTILQATNRQDSNSEFVSRQIRHFLHQAGEDNVEILSMTEVLPKLHVFSDYNEATLSTELIDIQDRRLIPSEKFIWILPEYNGSFPGGIKLFIDVLSVRQREQTWANKKSMLIGLATGRSGNIRGLDHFTSILLHLRCIVYPRLLPISRVEDLMDENGCIIHEPTLRVLSEHLEGFRQF